MSAQRLTNSICAALVAVLFSCALRADASDGAAPAARMIFPGRVVHVVDGDTVDVEVSMIVRVRLLADDQRGCWAPESRTTDAAEKKLGLAAKQHLVELAQGKDCLLDVPIRGPRLIDQFTMERLLAIVYVDGRSLGATQIATKHASSEKNGKLGK